VGKQKGVGKGGGEKGGGGVRGGEKVGERGGETVAIFGRNISPPSIGSLSLQPCRAYQNIANPEPGQPYIKP
jgi:hypothetical protein